MIITKTPFRLSFFGGGTDYRPWFEEHGGLVIGATFRQYCYISVRRLPPFFDYKTRVVYSKIEMVKDNREIFHPAVKGCLELVSAHDGFEIHHDGDLPARSGIGSSSSFTVGLLQALHGLKGEMLTKRALADEAIHVEQNILKENVGIQDQILAAYGGLQAIEMSPGGGTRVFPIVLPRDYRHELERSIMIGFSGFTRTASQIAVKQIQNINDGKSTSQLKEMHDIAKEGLDTLGSRNDIREIGKLFDRSWKLKRGLSSGITSDAIDAVYNKAIGAGAYGGRLMGAGGGGFMVFIAPPDRHAYIKQQLEGYIKVWVPFEFDDGGAQVILNHDRKA